MHEKPLLAGFLRDPVARRTLQEGDWEVAWVESVDQLWRKTYARAVRLFVIEATEPAASGTRDAVIALRRQQPLTDVVLWAPQASAGAVRTYFHAGAKDVIVTRSLSRLQVGLMAVLNDQQFLPRLSSMTRQRSRSARFESMLSRSEAMWELFELCSRIAPADATVLIAGETGTGKELLARAVHRRSGRTGRFVAANCASFPRDLVNAELFGYEKGAFTGADRAQKGLVRHADGGTLFLDEIGDMPPEGQLSLLRMLQEKCIRPLGSLVEVPVDVRVVAATHVKLHDAVRDGNFREDLFYRLDVIGMHIPALRQRPEDILFLFGHFAKQLAKHYGLETPTWSDQFLDALQAYAWPGNVRQLQNFCERLILARPQRALTADDFQRFCHASRGGDVGLQQAVPESAFTGDKQEADQSSPRIDTTLPWQQAIEAVLAGAEREYLQCLLRKHQGRIIAAAEQAGISRRTLLRKMRLYQIDKRDFKP